MPTVREAFYINYPQPRLPRLPRIPSLSPSVDVSHRSRLSRTYLGPPPASHSPWLYVVKPGVKYHRSSSSCGSGPLSNVSQVAFHCVVQFLQVVPSVMTWGAQTPQAISFRALKGIQRRSWVRSAQVRWLTACSLPGGFEHHDYRNIRNLTAENLSSQQPSTTMSACTTRRGSRSNQGNTLFRTLQRRA